MTFSITHFSWFAVVYVHKTFGDLAGVGWARKPIEVMASKGIIQGTGPDTFSPASNITRADYTVLLIRTLGLRAEFTDNFDDVKEDAYYYEAVASPRSWVLLWEMEITVSTRRSPSPARI